MRPEGRPGPSKPASSKVARARAAPIFWSEFPDDLVAGVRAALELAVQI